MSLRLFPSRHQICTLSEASRILSTCQFNTFIICKLTLGAGLWTMKKVVLQGVKRAKTTFISSHPRPNKPANSHSFLRLWLAFWDRVYYQCAAQRGLLPAPLNSMTLIHMTPPFLFSVLFLTVQHIVGVYNDLGNWDKAILWLSNFTLYFSKRNKNMLITKPCW